jgi:CRP-like cAMP-binding protein
LLRLAPHLHRAAESALADGAPDEAARLLADVVDVGRPPVDGLRLLALAARQHGADEAAERILLFAWEVAAGTGDLIGAVDALRRLDMIGHATRPHWTQLLDRLDTVGFADAPGRLEWFDGTGAPSDFDVDALFERAAAGTRRTGSGALVRPFEPVPLLSDLRGSVLGNVLRELQLRVVRDGGLLTDTSGSTPAWIASGAVVDDDVLATLRVGTLITPEPSTAVAHGPVRVLSLPPAAWNELESIASVRDALDAARRSARLALALRSSPLYHRMSQSFRDRFAQSLTCCIVRDEQLIERGRSVHGLFLLVHGSASVRRAPEDGGEEIARLAPGEVFGELDVLTAGGAEFDVFADGEVELCYLPAELAREILAQEPNAREYLVALIERRHEPQVSA